MNSVWGQWVHVPSQTYPYLFYWTCNIQTGLDEVTNKSLFDLKKEGPNFCSSSDAVCTPNAICATNLRRYPFLLLRCKFSVRRLNKNVFISLMPWSPCLGSFKSPPPPPFSDPLFCCCVWKTAAFMVFPSLYDKIYRSTVYFKCKFIFFYIKWYKSEDMSMFVYFNVYFISNLFNLTGHLFHWGKNTSYWRFK